MLIAPERERHTRFLTQTLRIIRELLCFENHCMLASEKRKEDMKKAAMKAPPKKATKGVFSTNSNTKKDDKGGLWHSLDKHRSSFEAAERQLFEDLFENVLDFLENGNMFQAIGPHHIPI